MYTTPLATTGEESTPEPVVYCQSNAPVAAFKAYTLESYDPIYTTPLATAGEEYTYPLLCIARALLQYLHSGHILHHFHECNHPQRIPRR